jgi:hypothetical protein
MEKHEQLFVPKADYNRDIKWKKDSKQKCLAQSIGYFYMDEEERSWYWLFKYESGE